MSLIDSDQILFCGCLPLADDAFSLTYQIYLKKIGQRDICDYGNKPWV